MSYSEDIRRRVLDYLSEGHTQQRAKQVFKVGISTMRSWQKQLSEQGHLKPKPLNRPFKKIDPEKLSAYISENPDAYLREIAEVFSCTEEAVRQALAKLKITRKKRLRSTVSETKKNAESSTMP